MKSVITIGREYGCGGREIAKALAEELHVPCYDRELILLAAEKSGLSHEVLEKVDETASNSFLYAVSTGSYGYGGVELPLNDKLFLAQSEVIRSLANEGPCVIVGRCADAVLEDRDNVASIFLWASMAYRVQTVMQRLQVNEKKATEAINKRDKKRASYYNFYTQKVWGKRDSYRFCIDRTGMEVFACAHLLAQLVQTWEDCYTHQSE